METVKVRRVGNSHMVSLPRALGVSAFVPGTTVAIDVIDSNTVVLKALPDEDHGVSVRAAIRESIKRSAEALALLEEYDRTPEH